MAEYNFNIPLKELDGEEKGKTLCKTLYEFLGTESGKENSLKLFGWYIKAQSNQPLELDEADRRLLSDLIEKSERLLVFAKGQLLGVLNK